MTAQKRIYLLNRLVNGGYFTPSGGMLSLVAGQSLFTRNAGVISKMYRHHHEQIDSQVKTITVPAYSGQHPRILEMIQGLAPLKKYLNLAVIHGSFATGEEIVYSDFDGLIVLSKELINDEQLLARVSSDLHQLRKVMHKIDPFQHHGWFVLSEYDIENYPEWFLPSAIFEYSRSLIGNTTLAIHIPSVTDMDFSRSFLRLCESVNRKLSSPKVDWNLYQLKAIFSEFMMLPSAYIQARDKKGIFKKFSFEEMRKDFTSQEYSVMDEVSTIRKNWKVELSEKQNRFFQRIDFLSWKSRQKISMAIPAFIEAAIHDGLFSRMNNFTEVVKNKLNLSEI